MLVHFEDSTERKRLHPRSTVQFLSPRCLCPEPQPHRVTRKRSSTNSSFLGTHGGHRDSKLQNPSFLRQPTCPCCRHLSSIPTLRGPSFARNSTTHSSSLEPSLRRVGHHPTPIAQAIRTNLNRPSPDCVSGTASHPRCNSTNWCLPPESLRCDPYAYQDYQAIEYLDRASAEIEHNQETCQQGQQ